MTIRMKKLISSFAVTAALLFTFSGQASAYFDGNGFGDHTAKLNRFMYAEPTGNKTDNEVGVDLFTDNGLSFPSYTFEGGSRILHTMDPGDVLNSFTTTNSWADINMGISAFHFNYQADAYGHEAGYQNSYFATTDTRVPDMSPFAGSHSNGAGNIWNEYTNAGTEHNAIVVGATADSHSYDVAMNQNSFVAGSYAANNNAPNEFFGEVGPSANSGITLAAFDSWSEGQNIYVDMYLWESEKDSFSDPTFEMVTDTYRAILRTGIDADGMLYTEIIPNAVPIPGAVWLLFSGMLAILGIHRKTSA